VTAFLSLAEAIGEFACEHEPARLRELRDRTRRAHGA
jgi:hypothetical protein